ncbi:MAG: AAA family ATPase [Clostridia bacterium]|nr:AAA family ATPase [Clostridia bacterium]
MKTCLIGNNINYSFSPDIHHMLGDGNYCIKNIPEDEIGSFFESREFDAFNVTVPYKEKVLDYIDILDETAKAVGAVNTVVLRNGKYLGFNTDVIGFEKLIRSCRLEISGKHVMILGSGGASKACRYVLEKLGAETVVVSRNGSINYGNYFNYSPDILINATPVGNVNDFTSIVDLKKLSGLQLVLDLSYNPVKPRLLIDAEKLGIKYVSGLDMLILQAKESHSIFFGEMSDADTETIRKILLNKMRNIVLIGMPGTGKTTVGKALAESIGYSFVDTDAEIEKDGVKIEDIFKNSGEEFFRECETEKVKEFSLKNNYVISCGGGVVLKDENIDYLKANGTIVLLTRNVSAENTKGRPLIKSEEDMKRLSQERKSLYDKYAEFTADNNKTVEDCVNIIKSALEII